MRTFFEASAFLVMALFAHLALWPSDQDMGVEGSGAAGDSLLTIAASSASVKQMVEIWNTPPETAEPVEMASFEQPDAISDLPDLSTPPPDPVTRMEQPQPTMYDTASAERLPQYEALAPQKMLHVPQISATPPPETSQAPTQQTARTQVPVIALPPAIAALEAPAPPMVQPPPERDIVKDRDGNPLTPEQSRRPPALPVRKATPEPERKSVVAQKAPEKKAAKPARKEPTKNAAKSEQVKKPSQASAASNARVAKGAGGGTAKGNNKQASTATLSKSARNSLLAQWGGQIRARIARRAPKGAGRGTVTLTITVSGSGALLGVRLAQSSGTPRIDKLALAAVRNAGHFPAAPKQLGLEKHTFRLPIKSR